MDSEMSNEMRERAERLRTSINEAWRDTTRPNDEEFTDDPLEKESLRPIIHEFDAASMDIEESAFAEEALLYVLSPKACRYACQVYLRLPTELWRKERDPDWPKYSSPFSEFVMGFANAKLARERLSDLGPEQKSVIVRVIDFVLDYPEIFFINRQLEFVGPYRTYLEKARALWSGS
jgi:hypothetical protein